MRIGMLHKGLFAQHGKALLEIGVVSAFGIVATAGFQIVASRGLGPSGFGLLASFLAIINVAAVGSAALRSSIAVVMSDSVAVGAAHPPARKRLDSSMIEALVLGGVCTVALLVASPWLTTSLETNSLALILTAATVLPYFLFSRAQGLLQGTGDSRSVVLWTSGSQIAQLALAAIALILGLGAIGLLGVILLTAVLGTLGSSYQARRFTIPNTRRPFSVDSSVVLLLTIAFAWLTNADVILVRSGTPELVAGSFAAAAVLVKTTLILPATLSLYLLPRFVSRRHDATMTKFGVNMTLGVTFLSGVAMFLLVLIAGGPLVRILFGAGYELTVLYLPWLALMWLPWAMALAVLVRITAAASKGGLLVLLVAAAVQWAGSTSLLPNVPAMMIFNGALGTLTLAALFSIHLARTRGPGGASSDSVPA